MGIYPYGKCKKCGHELTFFSGNMAVWGHADDCPILKEEEE
jgi:hypothetical protein